MTPKDGKLQQNHDPEASQGLQDAIDGFGWTVKCDGDNNPFEDIEAGKLTIDLGPPTHMMLAVEMEDSSTKMMKLPIRQYEVLMSFVEDLRDETLPEPV